MKRNLLISALLALLILIVQLVAGSSTAVVAVSVIVAFGISMGVLAVSDRYSRRG